MVGAQLEPRFRLRREAFRRAQQRFTPRGSTPDEHLLRPLSVLVCSQPLEDRESFIQALAVFSVLPLPGQDGAHLRQQSRFGVRVRESASDLQPFAEYTLRLVPPAPGGRAPFPVFATYPAGVVAARRPLPSEHPRRSGSLLDLHPDLQTRPGKGWEEHDLQD